MCRLKWYDVIILLSTIEEDHLQALRLLSLLSSFEPPSSKKIIVANWSLYRIECDNIKWISFTPSDLKGLKLCPSTQLNLCTTLLNGLIWRHRDEGITSKLVSWKNWLQKRKRKTFASWQTWHGHYFFSIRSCLQMLVTNIILVFKMTLAFTQFIPSRVDCVKTAHRCCIALFELLSGNCFCCHKLERANLE